MTENNAENPKVPDNNLCIFHEDLVKEQAAREMEIS